MESQNLHSSHCYPSPLYHCSCYYFDGLYYQVGCSSGPRIAERLVDTHQGFCHDHHRWGSHPRARELARSLSWYRKSLSSPSNHASRWHDDHRCVLPSLLCWWIRCSASSNYLEAAPIMKILYLLNFNMANYFRTPSIFKWLCKQTSLRLRTWSLGCD